jgi:hypothetical protein
MLMRFFCCTQPTHLGDANFLNTGLAKLQHAIGAVVSSVRGYLLRLYAETAFCLAHHRKQLSAIVGVATVDLIVNDHSGTILYQLQRAPKFAGRVKLALADGSRLSVVERNEALRDRLLPLKLLLGLAENCLGQFNLLNKLLLELGGLIRTAQRFKGRAALLQGMLGKLGHFLEQFSSFLLALLGIGFRRLTPAEKRSLGGPHVAGNLFTQIARRAGQRLYRLVNNPHVVRVADVSLKSSGIDPNPSGLNRSALQQLLSDAC